MSGRAACRFLGTNPPPRIRHGKVPFCALRCSTLPADFCASQVIGHSAHMLLPIGCCVCLSFRCVWGCAQPFPLRSHFLQILTCHRVVALDRRASDSCAACDLLVFSHVVVCCLVPEGTCGAISLLFGRCVTAGACMVEEGGGAVGASAHCPAPNSTFGPGFVLASGGMTIMVGAVTCFVAVCCIYISA